MVSYDVCGGVLLSSDACWSLLMYCCLTVFVVVSYGVCHGVVGCRMVSCGVLWCLVVSIMVSVMVSHSIL